MAYRVAFLGFSEFERGALASYFRLAHKREPAYLQVATLTDADLLVADADHGPSVQLVLATERLAETVFIGSQAPPGSAAWATRPISALRIMRELDRLLAPAAAPAPRDEASPPTTIVQAMQRRRQTDAAPTTSPALLGDLPFSAADPALGPAVKRSRSGDAGALAGEAAPLTLRDLPTPAAGAAPVVTATTPPAEIFPGTEGLVAHEPPLPQRPGTPLDDLPVLFPEPPPPTPPPAVLPATASVPQATVPNTVPANAPPRAGKPPKPPKVPKAQLLPAVPRVLLVDDSAVALGFLEARLGRWKFEFDRAPSGQAALALLAQHSYDLVFLDVDLGPHSELDGLALCQHVKQTPALMNALVVMVSAHHSELDRVRGTLAGCDAYLGKPVDAAGLEALLQRQGLQPVSNAGTTRA